jgi:acetolactate decarboxylase
VKLKRYFWLAVLLVTITVIVLPAYSGQVLQRQPGFQVSTLGALNVGVYKGAATFAQLKQHGDFGLGTLEGLDGEMIGLDGKFYQVKSDGIAYPVADEAKTPFATVAFFHKERSLRLNGQMNYQELQQQIDHSCPHKTYPMPFAFAVSFPI